MKVYIIYKIVFMFLIFLFVKIGIGWGIYGVVFIDSEKIDIRIEKMLLGSGYLVAKEIDRILDFIF